MNLKTPQEIEILAQGGHILAEIMNQLAARCRAGLTAAELDKKAEELIRQQGGEPSFKNFGPLGSEFPASLCVSPNELVVHGIPGQDLVFKPGDIAGLDLGMKYKGLFTDHAVTIVIGHAIQQYAEAQGYGVVRQLTGHGVGYAVHEDPKVPNFGEPGTGAKLKIGAVLAIEPMINLGTHEVKTANDGWGVITADDKLSAH